MQDKDKRGQSDPGDWSKPNKGAELGKQGGQPASDTSGAQSDAETKGGSGTGGEAGRTGGTGTDR